MKLWLKGRKNFETLPAKLRLEDACSFQKYLRITSENFEEIFQLIKDDISEENTEMRDPIPLRL